MPAFTLPLLSAHVAGCVHALETDHMAALGAGLLFHPAGAEAPLLARIMRLGAGATSGAVGCL